MKSIRSFLCNFVPNSMTLVLQPMFKRREYRDLGPSLLLVIAFLRSPSLILVHTHSFSTPPHHLRPLEQEKPPANQYYAILRLYLVRNSPPSASDQGNDSGFLPRGQHHHSGP